MTGWKFLRLWLCRFINLRFLLKNRPSGHWKLPFPWSPFVKVLLMKYLTYLLPCPLSLSLR